jgi:uncharacterized iron-regulated protein
MRKIFILAIALVMMGFSLQESLPAYSLFEKGGRHTSYEQMLDEIKSADIVLFGEFHNNPICHWLQLELTRDLYELKKEKLVLGAEMFESDNQLIINELIDGFVTEKKFEDEARLWKNYKTDYKPFVSFAAKNKIPFIATNIPRRYASLVYSKGFEALDSLSNEAKKLIAPLPPLYDTNLNCYRSLLSPSGNDMPEHANPNLPKSQAIKDATMAYFILENFKDGQLFLHFNGAYHSDNFEGIYWYLKQKKSKLKVVTISTVEQKQIDELEKESEKNADFIIAVDDDMTKTH